MINRDLIEIFIELAREKNIERSELGTIIEQLFLFIMRKKQVNLIIVVLLLILIKVKLKYMLKKQLSKRLTMITSILP